MTDRCLLESGVPVALLNKEARREKYAVPPHVLLQYYFTRKPLITARLAIAGSLLTSEDIKTREDFFQIMGLGSNLKKNAYRQVPDRLRQLLRKRYPDGLTILDPFAGSGTISLEALRMGFDTVALDYNPVAYLLMKGTLEYPMRYGGVLESGESKLYSDVKRYAEEIVSQLESELGRFYPNHKGQRVRCYIHAWAVKCPACGQVTPLVPDWTHDANNNIGIRPILQGGRMKYKIVRGDQIPGGNIHRGKATCMFPGCGHPISNDHIIQEISQHEREVLLALYLENGEFVIPSKTDQDAMEQAGKVFRERMPELAQFIPNEMMPDDKRALPAAKYLHYWYRLFSPRQLLVHTSMVRNIRRVVETLQKDDPHYAAAIGAYLSMILSKHLIRNSRAALWNRTRLTTEHVFTNRGISIMWSHPEVNPFEKTSGSLLNSISNILRGLRFLIDELAAGLSTLDTTEEPSVDIVNGSILSWQPSRKFSVIVTDPPYYDDVPYPELMQFLQVWYNKTVGELLDIPSIPSTSEELSVGRDRNKAVFESRMAVAIKLIHKLLEDDGILVLFYAHKSVEGWKYILESLRRGGFKVTSTHTLRTEGGGVISQGKSSVFHSLLLTGRKRLEDRTISIIDLEREVRAKMESRYEDLVRIYGDDRLNLMVAASGVVIESITSYSEIESFTDDAAEYALEMGQKYLIELFAKRSLNIDLVDPKTMLYAWLRYSPQKTIPFSEFNQTLKALGLEEHLVKDLIHKNKKNVKLRDFSERGTLEINGADPLRVTSVIDAVHLVLRGYLRGGVSEVTPLMRNVPFGEKSILHTIEGLAKLAALRPGYKEGEMCAKFLRDWGVLYDRGTRYQDQKLDLYIPDEEDDAE